MNIENEIYYKERIKINVNCISNKITLPNKISDNSKILDCDATPFIIKFETIKRGHIKKIFVYGFLNITLIYIEKKDIKKKRIDIVQQFSDYIDINENEVIAETVTVKIINKMFKVIKYNNVVSFYLLEFNYKVKVPVICDKYVDKEEFDNNQKYDNTTRYDQRINNNEKVNKESEKRFLKETEEYSNLDIKNDYYNFLSSSDMI